MTSTQGAGSYAGAVAEGRRTVVSHGVAGRGSAATGPTRAPGRGKGRGVTVAQSPAHLAHAAAQRDAREPGQGRVTSVGGSPKGSGTSGPRRECIIPGCRFTCGGWAQASCCKCPSATIILGDFRLDQSPRCADGSTIGTSPVSC